MIINNTGTFYVEGDYAQGDTILKAGDWELRANGSKNAFAYSPETFVRRNLLNWSEDFTTKFFANAGGSPTQTFIESPFNGGVATRVEGGDRAFGSSAIRNTLQDGELISLIALVRGSAGNRIQWRQSSGSFSSSAFFILDQDLNDWTWVIANGTQLTGGHQFIFRSAGGFIEVAALHIQKGHVDSTNFYQRTTTHVPRPFALNPQINNEITGDANTGWRFTNPSLVSIDEIAPDEFEITSTAAYQGFFQTLEVSTGAQYRLTFEWRNGTSNAIELVRSGYSGSFWRTSTEYGPVSIEFTAISSVKSIQFRTGSSTSGGTVYVKNVKLELLEPAPITLGNGNHKDFRYYPKTLSQNEVLELVK